MEVSFGILIGAPNNLFPSKQIGKSILLSFSLYSRITVGRKKLLYYFINQLLNTSTGFCYGQHGAYIKKNSIIAETEQGVAQAIIRSAVNFKRDPWPKVSDNAKDLVKKMLNPDPSKRLTAQEVLGKSTG